MTYPPNAFCDSVFFRARFSQANIWFNKWWLLQWNYPIRWTGYSTPWHQLTAAWAWSWLWEAEKKLAVLQGIQSNVQQNSKRNKCLKARKKSLLRISCLFKVLPWRLKTLRMFFLNEPLLCLVCKDPWSAEGWNHWGCFSLRKQMFRGQYKNNLSLLLLPPFRIRSQDTEYYGLSDLWEMPCRGTDMQIHPETDASSPVCPNTSYSMYVRVISAPPANQL